MFEQKTFENILKDLLNRAPANVDKRQGSIIYDALAPSAAELAQAYIDLETITKLMFAHTSSGEYLTMIADEVGIKRHPAIKSKRKGLFYDTNSNPMDIPIGSRYSLGELNYIVAEKLAIGQFALECETAGVVGNQDFGALVPFENISGLGVAELADVLVPGEEMETDEALLKRYLLKTQEPITSGNPNHYKFWALEVPGVGDARVTEVWNGNGTVKVALITSEKRAVDQSIADDVAEHIETERPVGAKVTVVPATEIPINISANLQLATWADINEVKTLIEDGVRAYLRTLAFADPDKPPYVEPLVRYTRIANILLDIPPIVDYDTLLVNGQVSNIEISGDEVAVLGEVEVWPI